MRVQRKVGRFAEFGRLLKEKRELTGFSAMAFWERNQEELGISYGRFASFERGELLPAAALVLVLAKQLGIDEMTALLRWASAAAEDPKIGARFLNLGDVAHLTESQTGYRIDSNSLPLSEFDNTWVLGKMDQQQLSESLERLDFLVLLETTWPEPQSYRDLGFGSVSDLNKFIDSNCRRWVEEGRIDIENGGVKLVLPHFHLPKTNEWLPLRKQILSRFVAEALPQLTPEALKSKQVHRTMTTRFLTEEQRRSIVSKLAAIEQEFFSVPFDASVSKENRKSYSLLILLALRSLQPGKFKS